MEKGRPSGRPLLLVASSSRPNPWLSGRRARERKAGRASAAMAENLSGNRSG